MGAATAMQADVYSYSRFDYKGTVWRTKPLFLME